MLQPLVLFAVETADAEIEAAGVELKYHVGTMIEIPRAALTADEIATEADFFCFGTNDLTQMTYGFSRDDAGKFLNAYYDAKIFENDPFAKLDQIGVGKLMEMSIKLGKPVNPNLHVGICGDSISYVSPSVRKASYSCREKSKYLSDSSPSTEWRTSSSTRSSKKCGTARPPRSVRMRPPCRQAHVRYTAGFRPRF